MFLHTLAFETSSCEVDGRSFRCSATGAQTLSGAVRSTARQSNQLAVSTIVESFAVLISLQEPLDFNIP